jgi:predicted TIM-barrel fold metal-dependent hydrolase
VKNVYADTGQLFAHTTISQPRLAAAIMGTLVKGMGHDHVIWGTDAIWTGAPQWQIEALRRLEIPEDMQKQYGYAPLGAGDGPVKNAIFGENVARLYTYKRSTELATPDRFVAMKEEYVRRGGERSNLRYGYVVKA